MEYIKNRKLEKQVGLALYPVNSLLVSIMSVQTVYTHTFHIFSEFEKKNERSGGGGSWKRSAYGKKRSGGEAEAAGGGEVQEESSRKTEENGGEGSKDEGNFQECQRVGFCLDLPFKKDFLTKKLHV